MGTISSIRSRDFRATQWQDWANLVLAVWSVDFTLATRLCHGRRAQCHPHNGGGLERVDRGDYYRGDFNRDVSESAALGGVNINLVAGVWLFVSPWLVNYSGTRTALWDALVVGTLVVILAAWDLVVMQRAVHHHA